MKSRFAPRLNHYYLLLVVILIMSQGSAFAQQHLIKRMGSEDASLFDEGWLFKRYGLQADGTRIEEPANLQETTVNDADWEKLSLPHDWAITGPFRIELDGATGKLPWKGIGWYRKHFTVPQADAGKKMFIDFDGAMAYAEVWINGNYVGGWPYGYTSFRMDITRFVLPGKENVIAVKLNTEKWDSRWYPGAGIYRHVWLVKTNSVHIDHWGTFLTTPKITNEKAIVNLDIKIKNESIKSVNATVQTTLYEMDQLNTPGKKVADTKTSSVTLDSNEEKQITSQAEIINPKRWDIKTPNRYIAKTTVSVAGKIVDTYYTPFGIRTIEFTANKGFLLNGNRVPIQGVCLHHDLGALGAAFNESALERQLEMLKEMGCNSIRTSHNPPAPELLEMADKMGFLVWDEAFDAWQKGKRKNDYNKLFKEWHDKDLTALIHRDRNHPSIFIWSIGNEVMEQQNVELTKHLAGIVHREDTTRPVSNGYNDPDGGRNSGAAVALDIMGVNYFFGQQARWDADARYANKPTLGSETSSCVSTRGEYYFGTDYQNWQISSYDHAKPGWGCSPDDQFKTNAKYPHLLGEYVWTGFDYLGEPTPYNSDETNLLNFREDPSKKEELEKQLAEIRKNNPPSRSSYFGVIDLAGFPKDRFYSYQAQWRPNLPIAHIFPHWNWPERIDSITPVNVYTSGDEGELFLNGKSLGRKIKVAGQDFRLTWDSVKYTPGELKVITYKNGKKWATDMVKTTGDANQIVLSANRTAINSNADELCFITAKVADKEGMLVPRSHPSIRFSIEGPGEIIATDNGDATSFVSFQSLEKPAFNGLLLAIVKAKTGMPGKITVKAESTGLETGVIIINAKK